MQKEEATQTLAFFRREGVAIKIIPGDNPVTVSAVARKAGVEGYENITRVASLFFIKTLYSAFLSLLSLLTLTPFPFIPIQITLMDGMLEGIPSFREN